MFNIRFRRFRLRSRKLWRNAILASLLFYALYGISIEDFFRPLQGLPSFGIAFGQAPSAEPALAGTACSILQANAK